MQYRRILVRLCFTSVMVALSVVLCRFLGYSPANTMYRVEIGFLPIAAVAVLAGPLYSALGYGLADLLGALMTTGMNPLILACKVLFGLLLGLFLYRRRCGIFRVALTMTVIGVAVDMALMAGVFYWMGWSPSYWAAFSVRSANAAVNLPIRILTLWLMMHFCRRIFRRYAVHFGIREGCFYD